MGEAHHQADAEWPAAAWGGHGWRWNGGTWSHNWFDGWYPWSWSWWSSPSWSTWDSWGSWRGWRSEEPAWSKWDWNRSSDQAHWWRDSGEESQGGWQPEGRPEAEPESSKEPGWSNWDWNRSSDQASWWKNSGEEAHGGWQPERRPEAEPESSKEPDTEPQTHPDEVPKVSAIENHTAVTMILPSPSSANAAGGSSEEPRSPVEDPLVRDDPWKRREADKDLSVQSRQASPPRQRELSRPPPLRPARDLRSKIFVSGLSGDTLPQTLGEYCQGVGEVRYATVYMDPDSGSSNGTGKVDFDSQETAERAIRELNGTTLDGCKILVQSLADVPAHFWQRRDTAGCAVFVGNLHPTVTREELQAFASAAGEVIYVRVFTDRQTGQSRGCGKVEYASIEQAEEAVHKLNGKALAGQEVTVEPMASERRPSVPKPQNTVFVGGLAPEMDEGTLLQLASSIGPVTFARIFRDRDSGRSRNCGKVEFETEDLAAKAVAELAGLDFKGRRIIVQPFGQASENSDPRRPQVDGRQVFIAGLTADTSSEMLREFCQMTVGAVDTARVFLNRETRESKGTGKVEFQTPELAQKAVQELNGRLLDGQRLSARLMEQERPSRPTREPREAADPQCRLFLANLPDEVSDAQLQELLQQAGEVVSASVFQTAQGNCMGRATMASAEEAARAVNILHDTFYVSKRITVRLDHGVKPSPQLDSTIFVGGLNFNTTSEGSGKVEFQTPDAALSAVQQLDGSELDGRQLHVKLMEAKPPLTRPPPGLRPPESGRQIFVSLSTETSAEMLREFCETCLGDGSVTYCHVFVDKDTGEPKGIGKLELASAELVDRALKELEGAMLQGSHLSLRRPGDRLPQEPDGRTVFVGGLSWDLDSKGLKAFGEQVGEVSYAAVFTNRETGKSKGSGKVQFANSELALKAVENLNGRELLGREVSVRMMEAQPRKPG
ncbi:unnamed protein product [Durusdinium trenchii]|uniref:RRM domain-containing protein n=1 Tax=Durusdinium trenchii TaxID=1381693 RepID=A0ABP0K3F8_9DINO